MRSDTYLDFNAMDTTVSAQAITIGCIALADIAYNLEESFPWSRVRRLSKKG